MGDDVLTVQWDKCWGKCRKELFQKKQHPTDSVGNACDIIFSTEPCVLDNAQVLSWDYMNAGFVLRREDVSKKWKELPITILFSFSGTPLQYE